APARWWLFHHIAGQPKMETLPMSFTRWLSNYTFRSGLRPRHSIIARRSFRPALEALEARWVPSTLTVTNTLDTAAAPLRAEVTAAHNGDTIVFASSLDGQTITLKTGELLLKHNLTITGFTDRNITISGYNASRVFELSGSSKPNVTMSGLTISNGYSPGS